MDWGLLEGCFAPAEEEGWAGLTILVSGNDNSGVLGGWTAAFGEGR